MDRAVTDWIAVGLSIDLAPASLTGTRIAGREFVLWRDAESIAHAWEDRCPHRGTRLSMGFVRNGRLTCLYHGWQFDAAAICRGFPAHPDLPVPETIQVSHFPCVEKAGFIWVWPDQTGTPNTPPQDSSTLPVRSLHIHAPATLICATLADAPPHLRIELQPVESTITALHAVLPHAIPDPLAAQLEATIWLEALRRRIETT